MGDFFELNKSIYITKDLPVDGKRYLAADIAARDLLITNGRAFNGLQVFVESEKKLYILVDISVPTWSEIATGGAIEGDKTYEYTDHSISASDIWTINNHGLNKKPSVVIVGTDNKEVTAEIEYLSNTEIRIYFNAPFAGKAFLN